MLKLVENLQNYKLSTRCTTVSYTLWACNKFYCFNIELNISHVQRCPSISEPFKLPTKKLTLVLASELFITHRIKAGTLYWDWRQIRTH